MIVWKLFNQMVEYIFGYKDFNIFKNKMKKLFINEDETLIFGEWCKLEKQIKNFKEGANLEKVKNKIKFHICFKVLKIDENIELNNLIEKYNRSSI